MATVSYDVVSYQIDTVSWDGDNVDEIATLLGSYTGMELVGGQLRLFGAPVVVGENVAVREDNNAPVEGTDGRLGIITDAVLANVAVYVPAV